MFIFFVEKKSPGMAVRRWGMTNHAPSPIANNKKKVFLTFCVLLSESKGFCFKCPVVCVFLALEIEFCE